MRVSEIRKDMRWHQVEESRHREHASCFEGIAHAAMWRTAEWHHQQAERCRKLLEAMR